MAAWNALGQESRSAELLSELEGRTLPPLAALLALDARCMLHFQRGEFAALREGFEGVLRRLAAQESLLAWWMVSPPTAWAAIPGMGDLVDRYCDDFEKLLKDVARNDRDNAMTRSYLTSDTGKVYTMLAHAAGRFS